MGTGHNPLKTWPFPEDPFTALIPYNLKLLTRTPNFRVM